MNSFRCFPLLFTLATVLAASGAEAAEKFWFVTTTEAAPPYVIGEGTAVKAVRPGLTIELLRHATQRVGVELEIRRVPWRRAVKMLEIDQADALFPASFKKERTALGVYPMKDGKPDDSRKIAEYSYYAYTTKDSGISLDGNQIKNADCPIGAMRLSAIIEQLKNTGHQVNEEETSRINLRKLLQGRICALVDLDFVIDPFLTSNPSLGSGIRKLSPAIRTKPYFLLFTKTFVKKWPVRTEQIWDAIGEFRRSPAFEDLRKKYGLL